MSGSRKMVSTSDFLKEAILDTQNTIRAIDTKLGAFLAALVLPFSLLGRAWAHISSICTIDPPWIGILLSILFFSLWILAIACITLGLAAIGNPARHIKSGTAGESQFYAGGLFSLQIADAFLNRKSVISKVSLEEYLSSLPSTKEEIEKQLAFEKLKTAYIRDIKIYRLQAGYRIAICWVATGASIFLISKFATS
ncbi:hypothetical protein NAU58_13735 [Pseudomonas stutzeri]|uniref:hypothetical protein n=1 Tax=Stutzerimonas stutzeri TaxID=316 RepID=UPI0011AF719A|nr:hypothetical protein [Stutzerimonas stutzeri]MCQ4296639.1 hypothetical protein [Stutzerimonas stutzeri]